MSRIGKLIEQSSVKVLHNSMRLAATATTLGQFVDTSGYEDAMIMLNVGAQGGSTTVVGPTTLTAQLYENENASMTGMVPVTSGTFSVVAATAGQGNATLLAAIKTQNYKRYLALQLAAYAPGSPTVDVSAQAVLFRGDSDPSGQTAQFDLEGY